MEDNVTIADPLQKGAKDDRHSAIMINKFNVKLHDMRGLLEAWAADAAYLKQSRLSIMLSFIAVYQAAMCFLFTTRCGNLKRTLIGLPVILLLGRLSHVIQEALQRHHIYSEKLLCAEPV